MCPLQHGKSDNKSFNTRHRIDPNIMAACLSNAWATAARGYDNNNYITIYANNWNWPGLATGPQKANQAISTMCQTRDSMTIIIVIRLSDSTLLLTIKRNTQQYLKKSTTQ